MNIDTEVMKAVFTGEVSMFYPSVCMNDAFQVVERIRELGWLTCLAVDERGLWTCQLAKPDGDTDYICGNHDTPAMAICKAALAAVGQETT